MNKKAQSFDFNNPNDWPGIILWVFVIFIVVGVLSTALYQFNKSLNCGDEIRDRDQCYGDRDAWMNYAYSLNDSINNCSNLIQEQIDVCDKRINDSVKDYEIKIEIYQNYVIGVKQLFIIYNILIIFIYLPLTINLFKIIFKIGLGEKWEQLIKWYKKGFLVVKILSWIILTLFLIFYLISFFSYNPVT